MLKLKSDLLSPTKFPAIPSAAGRSYNITKTLFEDSHAAISLIPQDALNTKGQKEQIKDSQRTLLYVQALEWLCPQHRWAYRHKYNSEKQV